MIYRRSPPMRLFVPLNVRSAWAARWTSFGVFVRIVAVTLALGQSGQPLRWLSFLRPRSACLTRTLNWLRGAAKSIYLANENPCVAKLRNVFVGIA